MSTLIQVPTQCSHATVVYTFSRGNEKKCSGVRTPKCLGEGGEHPDDDDDDEEEVNDENDKDMTIETWADCIQDDLSILVPFQTIRRGNWPEFFRQNHYRFKKTCSGSENSKNHLSQSVAVFLDYYLHDHRVESQLDMPNLLHVPSSNTYTTANCPSMTLWGQCAGGRHVKKRGQTCGHLDMSKKTNLVWVKIAQLY